MTRKICGAMEMQVWILMLSLMMLGVSLSEGHRPTREEIRENRPWQEAVEPGVRLDVPQTLNRSPVFRVRRILSQNVTTAAPNEAKSVWEEIEEFYSDSNNMAMYCVLPLIVLVYGGCGAIYCVHRCHRFIRRRTRKRRHTDTEGLVEEEERNNLNENGGGSLTDSDGQPIKTVSSSRWDEDNVCLVNSYNMPRQKTPLPWDTPQQIHRQNFAEKESPESREANNSLGSRGSSSSAVGGRLQRNDEDSAYSGLGEQELIEMSTKEMRLNLPPPSTINVSPRPHPATQNPRPVEIVPISRKEFQQRTESQNSSWDPLHHRPFESRAGGAGGGEGNGRESSWSIREEIMARYDTLTSLAMAKKTAEVLRWNAATGDGPPESGGGHRPDDRKWKAGGKKKLIFIAE